MKLNFKRWGAVVVMMTAMVMMWLAPGVGTAAPLYDSGVLTADSLDSMTELQRKQAAAIFRLLNGGLGSGGGSTNVNVGNWPNYNPNVNITNTMTHTTVTLTNYTGTDLVAGDVVFPCTEITNAVRVAGGHGYLHSITYRSANTNGTSVDIYLYQQPITAPANSSPFNYSASDGTNFIDVISLTTGDFRPYASTNSLASRSVNLGVWSVTNTSIYAVGVCRAAVTNGGNDMLTVKPMP